MRYVLLNKVHKKYEESIDFESLTDYRAVKMLPTVKLFSLYRSSVFPVAGIPILTRNIYIYSIINVFPPLHMYLSHYEREK